MPPLPTRSTLTTVGVLATLALFIGIPLAHGQSADAAAVVTAADIDRLTGAPWTGTLTYLDYTSKAHTTIKSSLAMARLPETKEGEAAWDMRVGYADEPHANSGEAVLLKRGGRTFRDAEVVERSVLADGTVRIVTEQDGPDDNRPARFRFVYLLGEKACSIQKLVRFTPQEAFFERHIYRWSR